MNQNFKSEYFIEKRKHFVVIEKRTKSLRQIHVVTQFGKLLWARSIKRVLIRKKKVGVVVKMKGKKVVRSCSCKANVRLL